MVPDVVHPDARPTVLLPENKLYIYIYIYIYIYTYIYII